MMPELARRFKARWRRVLLERPVRALTPNELANGNRNTNLNGLETRTTIGSAGDTACADICGAPFRDDRTTKPANDGGSDDACNSQDTWQHTAPNESCGACRRVRRRGHSAREKRDSLQPNMCNARALTLRFTCRWKPERGTSGGWKRSGASGC
jgi:hypothetical protein